MRADRQIAKRMQEMLLKDKMNVREGFLTMLEGDLNRVLNDYFEVTKKAQIHISQDANGEYVFKIEGCATRLKSFDTTLDMKRF